MNIAGVSRLHEQKHGMMQSILTTWWSLARQATRRKVMLQQTTSRLLHRSLFKSFLSWVDITSKTLSMKRYVDISKIMN
jgi:hypothetical protein